MDVNEALELIGRLSRTKNYPKEPAGLMYLAEGLMRACAETGAPPERVVMACATTSEWCPTDADLMTAARGLRPAEPQAGQRECPLQMCDGSGWRQVHHMHTHHPKAGGGIWTERCAISREAFDDLSRKVDWKTQMVYESRYRCACHPPRPEDIEQKGKYA